MFKTMRVNPKAGGVWILSASHPSVPALLLVRNSGQRTETPQDWRMHLDLWVEQPCGRSTASVHCPPGRYHAKDACRGRDQLCASCTLVLSPATQYCLGVSIFLHSQRACEISGVFLCGAFWGAGVTPVCSQSEKGV